MTWKRFRSAGAGGVYIYSSSGFRVAVVSFVRVRLISMMGVAPLDPIVIAANAQDASKEVGHSEGEITPTTEQSVDFVGPKEERAFVRSTYRTPATSVTDMRCSCGG